MPCFLNNFSFVRYAYHLLIHSSFYNILSSCHFLFHVYFLLIFCCSLIPLFLLILSSFICWFHLLMLLPFHWVVFLLTAPSLGVSIISCLILHPHLNHVIYVVSWFISWFILLWNVPNWTLLNIIRSFSADAE